MVYITHIRTLGGERAEHISEVRWAEAASGCAGASTRAQMVDYVGIGNRVRISGGSREVKLAVVHASPPYVRSVADGRETDDLLSLPRF